MRSTPVIRWIDALGGAALATMAIGGEPDREGLEPPERTIFDTLKAEPRRREWWAGRMVAKAALAALGARPLAIAADPRGVPRLEGQGADRWFIAISHGRRLASAIAASAESPFPGVGVDIVDDEDRARIEKLEARVLTPHERALADVDRDARILAWGAREAIAKATATGMFAFALKGVSIQRIERAPLSVGGFGRIEVALEGAEILFEPLADGGILVAAGCTRTVGESARRTAGLAE
jgi:4'-phosphopantetheinyl transferase EntD